MLQGMRRQERVFKVAGRMPQFDPQRLLAGLESGRSQRRATRASAGVLGTDGTHWRTAGGEIRDQ